MGQVGRFYTRSRRFPKLIGKLPDGSRIWGGPYTISQLLSGVGFFVLAMVTRSIWSFGSLLLDLPLAAAATFGVVKLVGMIPTQRRSAARVVTGAIISVTRPAAGTYRGRRVMLTKPHGSITRVALELEPAPESEPETTAELKPAQPVAVPIAAVSVRPVTAATGLERLMIQARQKQGENA